MSCHESARAKYRIDKLSICQSLTHAVIHWSQYVSHIYTLLLHSTEYFIYSQSEEQVQQIY
jgi:hypothetical protein